VKALIDKTARSIDGIDDHAVAELVGSPLIDKNRSP
jgi:hypothetical protein